MIIGGIITKPINDNTDDIVVPLLEPGTTYVSKKQIEKYSGKLFKQLNSGEMNMGIYAGDPCHETVNLSSDGGTGVKEEKAQIQQLKIPGEMSLLDYKIGKCEQIINELIDRLECLMRKRNTYDEVQKEEESIDDLPAIAIDLRGFSDRCTKIYDAIKGVHDRLEI